MQPSIATNTPSGQQRGPIVYGRPSILRRPGRKISGYRPGSHEAGTVVKFGSGTRYLVSETGSLIKATPKPWRTKAERKQHLKARRMSRDLALAS